jgi:hypothetical protein
MMWNGYESETVSPQITDAAQANVKGLRGRGRWIVLLAFVGGFLGTLWWLAP